MAEAFNTTLVKELKLILPELNHKAQIYAKYHLTDKLLSHDLTLGREILHDSGIIFNFKNKARIFNLNETTQLYGKRIYCYQR